MDHKRKARQKTITAAQNANDPASSATVQNSEELFARFPDRDVSGSIFTRIVGIPAIRSAAVVCLLDGLPDVARILRFFGVADSSSGNYRLEVTDGVELTPAEPDTAHLTIIEDMDRIGSEFVRFFASRNGID